MKILSIHDLQIIRKRAEHNLSLREESNEKVTEKCYGLASGAQHLQILICGGTGCKASSSQGITDNLLKAIKKNEITDKVEVITVGCFGFCEKGPIVKIIPDNTFYTQVTPEDAEEIINEHIIGGRRIERLLYVDPKTEHTVSDSKHMDFYRKQMRIALRNCGFIDPENIEEYLKTEKEELKDYEKNVLQFATGNANYFETNPENKQRLSIPPNLKFGIEIESRE